MAIYIIGLLENGSEKLVRLYNDKKNQYRDMREKDVLFMLDEETIKVKNAGIKGDKLVGTTGSLEKIKNKTVYVALGYISDDTGKPVSYKFVDSNGKVYIIEVHDCIGFFEKNIIQNASLVDGKFVRGINWELPCVEQEKKKPKNLSIVSGMGYAVKKNKNLPQNDIILYWSPIEDAVKQCIEDRLELSWRGFGLRVPNSYFDLILEKLSDIEQNIWVDKEQEDYRIIYFYELYKDINKDIEYIKEITKKLDLKLSLFVDNNIHLSHHDIGLSNCNTLINYWGAEIECENSKAYFNIGGKKHPISFSNNAIDPQTDWLHLWDNSVGYLYQQYFIRKISKKFDLYLSMNKGYSMVETPTKVLLGITIMDNDNKIIIHPKVKEKNKLKDNKVVAEFNIYDEFPSVSIDNKINKMNITLNGYAVLYVSQNIWNDILSAFLSKKSIHKKVTNFNISRPGCIVLNFYEESKNKTWLSTIECMAILKQYIDFEGYVDIHRLANPLYTMFDDNRTTLAPFFDGVYNMAYFESINGLENVDIVEAEDIFTQFYNYDLIYTGCVFCAKKLIKVFNNLVKSYGFKLIKPKMSDLEVSNYKGELSADVEYLEDYLKDYSFDASCTYHSISYSIRKK